MVLMSWVTFEQKHTSVQLLTRKLSVKTATAGLKQHIIFIVTNVKKT